MIDPNAIDPNSINATVEWLTTNWSTPTGLWIIVTSAIAIASVIVKATPNQTDDKWLAKIIAFLKIISLNKKDTK
jgi:aminopeptidase N